MLKRLGFWSWSFIHLHIRLNQRINTHWKEEFNLIFIENVIFNLNKFNISKVSWASKPLWLFKSRVARPRSWKDIPRWDIDLPNISKPNIDGRNLDQWGVLVHKDKLSLVNDKNTLGKHQRWQKTTRECNLKKNKNVNKEQWNCKKQ
jgi:hypothetical protein